MTHLTISPKLANHLFKKGILIPLLDIYDKFIEQQNYAFKVKDRNIARLAVIKALAEGKEVDVKRVKEIAKSLLEDDKVVMKPADKNLKHL